MLYAIQKIFFKKQKNDRLSKKEINFVYPVHGGFIGQSASKLSFGKFKIYDSLAPEFDTYETIKKLSNKKSKQ